MLALFLSLVLVTALTRLFELQISRRHRRALLAQGAKMAPDPGFQQMVCLHVGILAVGVLEVLLLGRSIAPGLGLIAALGVVAANGLRIWAIVTLGVHWNVRVINSTCLGVVVTGPYRWIRHPNYVAVFVELCLLPLVHGALVTAAAGTALHLLVLRRRILTEEATLLADDTYRAVMGPKPRFIPRFGELFAATRLYGR